MFFHIAYLSSKDPFDKKQSSGVYYFQSKALAKHCGSIYFLGPIVSHTIKLIKKSICFRNRFSKKRYISSHNLLISKLYGHLFSKKLRKGNYNIVFADKASNEIAHLNTELPIVYSTDATFAQLKDYYPGYSQLADKSITEGNRIEFNAIHNATIVICASQWAANSVVKDYGYPAEKTYVLPRGANIDMVPDFQRIVAKRKNSVCHLLYMGKEWHRKGYDIAFNTMRYIRNQGFEAKLISVGFTPPHHLIDENVEVIPYIDKNTQSGRHLFDQVMYQSDFYLLPTRAECMGIAFCESAAYGLPVITRDTGGVTEVVKNGINGFALEKNAGPIDFGKKIIELFHSNEQYYNLILSSRKYYEERLNWDSWGKNVKKILDSHFMITPPLQKEDFTGTNVVEFDA